MARERKRGKLEDLRKIDFRDLDKFVRDKQIIDKHYISIIPKSEYLPSELTEKRPLKLNFY